MPIKEFNNSPEI